MIDSILVLALIVLPGWLSITVNQLYYPRSTGVDKSTVMEWGMVLYHAMVVHALAVTCMAITILLWPGLWTTGFERIIADGPISFTRAQPATGIRLLAPYFLGLVVISILTGVIHLPSRTIAFVAWLPELAKWAPERLREDPVWYSALTLDRKATQKPDLQLRVRMKNGDTYVGNLHSYPILPDSEDAKDLRLGDSIFYPAGDVDAAEELNFSEYGGGGVLLNTSNVSSIEYMYHDNYKASDQV